MEDHPLETGIVFCLVGALLVVSGLLEDEPRSRDPLDESDRISRYDGSSSSSLPPIIRFS